MSAKQENALGSINGIPTIAIASSEEEKKMIYRFRYQIHIEEMRRMIPGANYETSSISDSMDQFSHLVYATHDANIIGTVRVTIGKVGEFPEDLIRAFQLDKIQEFDPDATICFNTKLMVAPQFRKTTLTSRLTRKTYEIMREHHVQFGFGGCNPYLIPLYEQLGYRQFIPGFQDPGYGFVVPILLISEDFDYLTAVRSSFMKIARKFPNSNEAKEWFFDNFSWPTKYTSGLLVSEDDRPQYIIQKTGITPFNFNAFQGIDQSITIKLLQIGTIVDCLQGTDFLRPGDVCNEMNVLISGSMNIQSEDKTIFQAKPGEQIGSMGLMAQTYHKVTAHAATDCEMLVISRLSFEKLQRFMPQVACTLGFTNNEGGWTHEEQN